jgi:hypothetical protein
MKRAGRPVLVLLAVLALTILTVGSTLAAKPGQQGHGASKARHTQHANGTVRAVSGSSITVLPKHGDPLTFTVVPATRVLGDASNGPLTIASVTAGMHVNVVGQTTGTATVPTARIIVILGTDGQGQGAPKGKGQHK